MRKFAYIFICLGMVLCIASCKKKVESEDIVVDKIIEKPQTGPIAMPEQDSKGNVTWISGTQYTYTIIRNVDSVRVVSNHGKDYRDNNITLVVNRQDGTEFFKKSFSKENFKNVLPETFIKSGVLTNMRLDGAEGNNMNFVVTVGAPDENIEDFFLVKMTLDNLGHTSASEYHEVLNEETQN